MYLYKIEATSLIVYSCRKCRVLLCKDTHLENQEVGKHSFSHHRLNKDKKDHHHQQQQQQSATSGVVDSGIDDDPSSSSSSSSSSCTSLFLKEPLQWMKAAASADPVEEKLVCYNCGTRVGALRWAGGQCSCGTWVCPAIVLYKKSLDSSTIVTSSSSSSSTTNTTTTTASTSDIVDTK